MKPKEIPLFIMDASVIVKIFEGKNDEHSREVIDMIAKMKAKGMPFQAVTTLSSFLRAVWLADSRSNIKEIQKFIETFKILPTLEIDYKNEDKVRNDIIEFANMMSGNKKK